MRFVRSLILLAAAAGCASPSSDLPGLRDPGGIDAPVRQSADARDEVVARINGRAITMRDIQSPLIEAHGLNVLLNVVQLDLARQSAAETGVDVTDEDVEREHELTIERMFEQAFEQRDSLLEELEEQRQRALAAEGADAEDVERRYQAELAAINEEFDRDIEQYFEQFLAQERLSRVEFDLVMQTNAHLRKIGELLIGERITEETLREAFGALYGETIRVRHIQLANLQEVAEARRRLAEGEDFEQVAMEMSRNPRTAGAGGELPTFSRAMTGLPETFKDAAFALQEGEISDPVQADGAYHLIRLEQRFEPRAVRFEDVKDSVREMVYEQWLQATIRELRTQIAQQALETMRIEQPVLRRQFEQRMLQSQEQAREPQEIGGDQL